MNTSRRNFLRFASMLLPGTALQNSAIGVILHGAAVENVILMENPGHNDFLYTAVTKLLRSYYNFDQKAGEEFDYLEVCNDAREFSLWSSTLKDIVGENGYMLQEDYEAFVQIFFEIINDPEQSGFLLSIMPRHIKAPLMELMKLKGSNPLPAEIGNALMKPHEMPDNLLYSKIMPKVEELKEEHKKNRAETLFADRASARKAVYPGAPTGVELADTIAAPKTKQKVKPESWAEMFYGEDRQATPLYPEKVASGEGRRR